jgi:hypothetical protein
MIVIHNSVITIFMIILTLYSSIFFYRWFTHKGTAIEYIESLKISRFAFSVLIGLNVYMFSVGFVYLTMTLPTYLARVIIQNIAVI